MIWGPGEFPGHGTAGKEGVGGRGQNKLIAEFFVQRHEENAIYAFPADLQVKGQFAGMQGKFGIPRNMGFWERGFLCT